MATTVNEYEIGRDAVAEEGYGDEVVYAGWNPQLASAAAQKIRANKFPAFPGELATADIDTFLQKMYAYQR